MSITPEQRQQWRADAEDWDTVPRHRIHALLDALDAAEAEQRRCHKRELRLLVRLEAAAAELDGASMSIKVTRTCDGCGQERELATAGPGAEPIEQAARLHGWREVLDRKHLCVDCLRRAMGGERVVEGPEGRVGHS